MYIVIGVIIIISIIIGLLSSEPETIIINQEPQPQTYEEISYIYVDIKGEVNNPGVYKITSSTRLYQLIDLAGGLTDLADPLKVNMAITLRDQDMIYIPSIFDIDIVSPIEEEDELIDINRASKELLTTLPGIGEATAEAIITYREEVGYFDTIEDIMNVSGIGEATYNNIKDLIRT